MKLVIMKSLSWMLVSGVLIFLSAWISTGDMYAALTAAISASGIKTLLYGVHERLWERAT